MDQPLRIALMIETDGPGGAETVLLHLAHELRELGHYVLPVGPAVGEGWLSGELASRGFPRETVDLAGGLAMGPVRDLTALFQREAIDVAHAHEFSMAMYGAAASRRARCAHVITMHGGLYYSERLRRRLVLRTASRWSGATVAVSDQVRRLMLDKLWLPDEAVTVVLNGVSPRSGDPAPVRAELGLNAADVLVLAVGNLYPVKAHSVLLEALSRLETHDGPGRVVVAVAGRGKEEERLRAYIAQAGLGDRAHLLGFRGDVPDLLAAADVFAMPSISEGLPMAVIEAMLAGKAILASDVGGMSELLPSSDHGLLLPAGDAPALADALHRVAADSTMRQAMGAAAKARAEQHFSARAMALRYLEIFDGLVPAASTRPRPDH